jgi:hypothetical protein
MADSKTTMSESVWARTRMEAWPHLSKPPFAIIHVVAGAAAGVLAPVVLGEDESAISKAVIGVIGSLVALLLVGAVVMVWLLWRVP